MVRLLIVLIEIIVCFLLQTAVFSFFRVSGVVPDCLLILVITIAYTRGQISALFVGFFSGLLLDLYKEFGVDSYIGQLGSILMSCSETIFYTMSVYFMTANVKQTRYTLPGALVATFAGVAASVFLVNLM